MLGQRGGKSVEMKTVLGNFDLVEQLASGGMGTVYRAVQLSLKRSVAVKELRSQFANDPQYISRFEREAVALGSMSNENIVGVIEFGQYEGAYYIVMEYVDGLSLSNLVKSYGKLPANVALTIIENAARGMAYAHRKGIIHRDINPANIMISRDGVVKITDFGLCRPLNESADVTIAGAIMGTPQYMSPEQALGTEVDHRSDIYSLGLVFYELLTAEPSVEGTVGEVLGKILRKTPIPLQKIPPEIPRQMVEILRKCTQPDVETRYQSAAELLAAIRKFRMENEEYNAPAPLDAFLAEANILPKSAAVSKTVESALATDLMQFTAEQKAKATTPAYETSVEKKYFRFIGRLKDLDIRNFIVRYHDFFLPTDEYRSLVEELRAKRSVLMIGRPGSGKSRAIFQALHQLSAEHPDWQVIILRTVPIDDVEQIIPLITTGVCVIVWEDIDQYVSFWEPAEVFPAISHKARNLLLLGTIRIGDEYRLVETHRTDWLYFFDKQIRQSDLSDENAVSLAEGVNAHGTDQFDGTPASIVLDLRKVKVRYGKLQNPHRSLLRAMKMLSIIGIWSCRRKLIHIIAEKLFGCSIDRSQLVDAMKYLIENTFIKRDGEGYCLYHKVYAKKVITDYDDADMEEDISELTDVVREFGDPYYIVNLSHYFWLRSDIANASELCNLAIELKPDFPEAYLNRGMVKASTKDYEGAIADYTKAIELNPELANAYNNRGVSRRRIGNYDGAIADYDKAIALKPDFALAYSNRGYAYFKIGKYDEARRDFNKAAQFTSEYASLCYVNLGILALYDNRFDDAWEAFKKAVEIDENNKRLIANETDDILPWLLEHPDKAGMVCEELRKIVTPEKLIFDQYRQNRDS